MKKTVFRLPHILQTISVPEIGIFGYTTKEKDIVYDLETREAFHVPQYYSGWGVFGYKGKPAMLSHDKTGVIDVRSGRIVLSVEAVIDQVLNYQNTAAFAVGPAIYTNSHKIPLTVRNGFHQPNDYEYVLDNRSGDLHHLPSGEKRGRFTGFSIIELVPTKGMPKALFDYQHLVDLRGNVVWFPEQVESIKGGLFRRIRTQRDHFYSREGRMLKVIDQPYTGRIRHNLLLTGTGKVYSLPRLREKHDISSSLAKIQTRRGRVAVPVDIVDVGQHDAVTVELDGTQTTEITDLIMLPTGDIEELIHNGRPWDWSINYDNKTYLRRAAGDETEIMVLQP